MNQNRKIKNRQQRNIQICSIFCCWRNRIEDYFAEVSGLGWNALSPDLKMHWQHIQAHFPIPETACNPEVALFYILNIKIINLWCFGQSNGDKKKHLTLASAWPGGIFFRTYPIFNLQKISSDFLFYFPKIFQDIALSIFTNPLLTSNNFVHKLLFYISILDLQ